ncbi:MAG TPA: MBL fold metallo-hydrolase [Polyangia bacterium]
MQISFFGVRALVPVPGPATVRHGGNTACVLVRLSDGGLLVLDCGTGARGLGLHLLERDFAKGQREATFLLSHPRWDRVQGFPFFRPFYTPSNRFTIYGGLATAQALEAVLEGQMAAHYFPLHTFRNMGAALDLRALAPGAVTNLRPANPASPLEGGPASLISHGFSIGSAHVRALVQAQAQAQATQPDQPSEAASDSAWAAYRIEDAGRVLVYAAAPVTANTAARALCSKADLLVHHAGAMDSDDTEEPGRDRGQPNDHRIGQTERTGHADQIDKIVDLAREAAVKNLVLFDYDPDASDTDVDRMLVRAHRRLETAPGPPLGLRAAAEGATFDV